MAIFNSFLYVYQRVSFWPFAMSFQTGPDRAPVDPYGRGGHQIRRRGHGGEPGAHHARRGGAGCHGAEAGDRDPTGTQRGVVEGMAGHQDGNIWQVIV